MQEPPRPKSRWSLPLEIAAAFALAPLGLLVAARLLHGKSELVRVGDHQVAVVLDRWTGATRVTSVPGLLLRIPWLHEVTLLDRSPSWLFLGMGPDGGAPLLVRSSDGSSFRVEQVVVQYAIRPDAAATALAAFGPGANPAHEVLGAYAGSILRDELGRATAEEISRGEKLQDVVVATTARLQAAIAPQGIAILGVSFAKPDFDEAYEDAIERTKTFRQQADELAQRAEEIQRGRPAREAAAAKKKELELAKLEGDLVRDRGHALRDALQARQEADDFHRSQTSEGEAARLEKVGQAAIVQARNVAAARDVQRDGADLELAGDLSVRKALVERLGEIRIDLVPRTREATEPKSAPATP